jgi:hypothetical protein
VNRKILPLSLLLLGLVQMVADLAGAPRLAALAFASGLSPAPKVFTTQAGYEGFSTGFVLHAHTEDGETRTVRVSPARYAAVLGPYNRRNALGAAIAGAPLLRARPELTPMLDSVAAYALCGDAPLLYELGMRPSARIARVTLELDTRDGVTPPAPVEVPCP